MRDQLLSYLSQYDGGFNHRSATRYLYKREPELWECILEATSFLPNDAKAKQRCWHILNDVYSVPLCPEENIEVRWFENRYLTYSSPSAKTQHLIKIGKINQPWDDNEERKEKVRETYYKNREAGNHTIVESPFKRSEVQEKAKATNLERYGYENPFFCSEKQKEMSKWMQDEEKYADAKEKAKQTRIENGLQIPDEEKTDRELYYNEVQKVTERNYKQYKHIINPNDLPRTHGKYHLDHIYSKHKAYQDGIEPEIVGHYTNLRMLWHSENESKNFRSDKTKDQLFEDYKNSDDDIIG